jgi:DNA-binding beta-propeller fold protein YncE
MVVKTPKVNLIRLAWSAPWNELRLAEDTSTGALSPFVGSPFANGQASPVEVAVNPTGRFVYVANVGRCSCSVSATGYAINANTGF